MSVNLCGFTQCRIVLGHSGKGSVLSIRPCREGTILAYANLGISPGTSRLGVPDASSWLWMITTQKCAGQIQARLSLNVMYLIVEQGAETCWLVSLDHY